MISARRRRILPLHGDAADMAIEPLAPNSREMPALGCAEIETDIAGLIIARRKSIGGGHWIVIAAQEAATEVHRRLLQRGAASSLVPAGSLTYNSLRIRSGRPAGLELSSNYIPLEVGLWDEVSFTKGLLHGSGNHRQDGEPAAPGEDACKSCSQVNGASAGANLRGRQSGRHLDEQYSSSRWTDPRFGRAQARQRATRKRIDRGTT